MRYNIYYTGWIYHGFPGRVGSRRGAWAVTRKMGPDWGLSMRQRAFPQTITTFIFISDMNQSSTLQALFNTASHSLVDHPFTK